MHVPRGSLRRHNRVHQYARQGRNYRGRARNLTLRGRLCNAKTSPTCVPWHLLNLALASSPFISGYCSVLLHCLERPRCLRLRSQPSSRDLLESTSFILGPRRASFPNALHRRSDIQRGRFNLVSPSKAENLRSSSFAARDMQHARERAERSICMRADAGIKRVQLRTRKEGRERGEGILRLRKNQKSARKNRYSSRTLLLDFSLETFLDSFPAWMQSNTRIVKICSLHLNCKSKHAHWNIQNEHSKVHSKEAFRHNCRI